MNFGRTLREMHRQVRREPGVDTVHMGTDELFDVLADSRRRFVIERLADDDRDPVTASEVAVEIAAAETHMPVDQVPPRRVRPVEDDLRAEQLPRLVDVGIVRWDGGDAEIRPGHSIEAMAGLLRDVDRLAVDQTGYDASTVTIGGSLISRRARDGRPREGRHRP